MSKGAFHIDQRQLVVRFLSIEKTVSKKKVIPKACNFKKSSLSLSKNKHIIIGICLLGKKIVYTRAYIKAHERVYGH